MYIEWTRHSKKRFAEKGKKYALTSDELEAGIEEQKIRITLGKHKYKTIFRVRQHIFTIVKIEKKKNIKVVTLWESSKREVTIWKNR